MGLVRLLLVVLVIWLLLSVIRWMRRRVMIEKTRGTTPEVARMVRCAYCGLYVTSDEAVRAGGESFCSNEHKAAKKRNLSS